MSESVSPPPGAVDLHTHTTCSDGRLSPAELVRKAAAAGLAGLAVTDHDSVSGLTEAAREADASRIDLIPGVELSVTVGKTSVHMLGYYFNPDSEALQARLAAFRESRLNRGARMVERLNRLGVGVRLEDVLQKAAGGAVGRPHVAAALVAGGFAETTAEAFERYLSDDGPAYVPHPVFEASEALRLLHAAGGIGVLAHPGTFVTDETLRRLIDAGLDGIEVVHPAHTPSLSAYFRSVARRFALVQTGGSDYHGYRPYDEEHFGRYTVPYENLDGYR